MTEAVSGLSLSEAVGCALDQESGNKGCNLVPIVEKNRVLRGIAPESEEWGFEYGEYSGRISRGQSGELDLQEASAGLRRLGCGLWDSETEQDPFVSPIYSSLSCFQMTLPTFHSVHHFLVFSEFFYCFLAFASL